MPTCLFVHPGAELFGSDRMLAESVIGALAAGFRCVVALPEDGPLAGMLRAVGAEVEVAPMLVLRKSLLRPRGWVRLVAETFRGLGSAWRLMSRIRPDCVYVSTITIPQWPVVARLRRRPALSHVHEAEASGSRLVNTVLYLPHLLASAVVVNSRFSLDTIARSLPRLADRAKVVYNGVAGPADASPPRAALDGSLRVLYLGRLSPRKGPHVLVDAVRICREDGLAVQLALVGSVFAGYDWYEQELRDQVADAGITEQVTFHGFQPEVWPFLDASDVLVVPSTVDEPFGNTAVEGILALRPVVASDTSGLREAAGPFATARLVPPGDPDALAAALGDVVSDWESLSAGVGRAAAAAHDRHAPELFRSAIAGELLALAALAR